MPQFKTATFHDNIRFPGMDFLKNETEEIHRMLMSRFAGKCFDNCYIFDIIKPENFNTNIECHTLDSKAYTAVGVQFNALCVELLQKDIILGCYLSAKQTHSHVFNLDCTSSYRDRKFAINVIVRQQGDQQLDPNKRYTVLVQKAIYAPTEAIIGVIGSIIDKASSHLVRANTNLTEALFNDVHQYLASAHHIQTIDELAIPFTQLPWFESKMHIVTIDKDTTFKQFASEIAKMRPSATNSEFTVYPDVASSTTLRLIISDVEPTLKDTPADEGLNYCLNHYLSMVTQFANGVLVGEPRAT